MSASEPQPGNAVGSRRYGWLARRRDRFHGWLDGFQHRPDVTGDDVRTAYWHRLVQWAAELYTEEQQLFLREYGPAMAKHQADLKELVSRAEEVERLERTLAHAQGELDSEKKRLDASRDQDPHWTDTHDNRRQRRLQLFDFERAVNVAAGALEQARRQYNALDREIERLATSIRLGEEVGRNRANQVWGFAKQRINVYLQSLVRSHPNGLVLEQRFSRLATDPPDFTRGIDAAPRE